MTMRERITRALLGVTTGMEAAAFQDDIYFGAQDAADRALVALRHHLTQGMIDAATTATSGTGLPDHDYDEDIRVQWRAMIDAASQDK